MVALEAQESKSDFGIVCDTIQETCPDARVTSWSGQVNSRGIQTYKVTFVVNKAIDPPWLESTFGKMFAKGLISIDVNTGMSNINANYGPVSFQAAMPSSTVQVEIKNVSIALYEMNKRLAWKRSSAEFTVLMDDLLRK